LSRTRTGGFFPCSVVVRALLLLALLLVIIIPAPLFASQPVDDTKLPACQLVHYIYGTAAAETDTDFDLEDTEDGLDLIYSGGLTTDCPVRIFSRGKGIHNEEFNCRGLETDRPDRAPPHCKLANRPYKFVYISENYLQQLQIYYNPKIKSEQIPQLLTIFPETQYRVSTISLNLIYYGFYSSQHRKYSAIKKEVVL